ncbi:MAG TPA: hypothetical protein VHH73_10565 [Verrucomicrobiae bacterium]|nr:hypothetical protein [Verrucomicrobiae bacterium]
MSPGQARRLQAFHEQYARMTGSPNPGYSNVLEVLNRYASRDPLDSDLFKDGCAYVGSLTEFRRRAEEEIGREQEEIRKAESLKSVHTPEWIENARRSLAQGREVALNDFTNVMDGYTAAFSFRFKEYYGITNQTMVEELSHLVLTNAGPELRIPCPQ